MICQCCLKPIWRPAFEVFCASVYCACLIQVTLEMGPRTTAWNDAQVLAPGRQPVPQAFYDAFRGDEPDVR